MADHILFAGSRWEPRPKSQSGRIVFLVVGLVLLVLAGEAVFRFLLAPNLRINTIKTDEHVNIAKDDILRMAGIEGPLYYFLVNTNALRKNLEASPAIKQAVVEKSFPDTLRIQLVPRVPLALAVAETGGELVPLAFDEEGMIFETGSGVTDWTLPVVSGIRFEGVKPGTRLPSMLGAFLKELKDLKNAYPALFGCFSEYRIVKKGEGHFEILLYPMNYKVPVRIEASLSVEKAKMVLMVLDVLDKEKLLDKVEEIDFRTGDVIYRLKEE